MRQVPAPAAFPPPSPGAGSKARQANRVVHNRFPQMSKEKDRVDRRQAYELEVLSAFARFGNRAPELSDADRDNEILAQRRFFAALSAFKREVQAALNLSELRKDALTELLAHLDDTAPDALAWEEAIADSRSGYR